MPNRWATASPEEFMSRRPTSSGQFWLDIGVLSLLSRKSFGRVVSLHGVFQDSENTSVMLSLASLGDIFSWSGTPPRPGLQREAVMEPTVAQSITTLRGGASSSGTGVEGERYVRRGRRGERLHSVPNVNLTSPFVEVFCFDSCPPAAVLT